ncbi:hypothetical protein PHSY_004474 [Pseudozyma hubeiensis SY62]|uniref:ELYS-like domain-containing protein n=1 Tax=Pseudozyma hubeiensis (strain SY62) TaxID=1305764 RepID=R9PFP5_PSEHS|nr:hypothetical protein PHSY_004474 [Pseudozyma hubeiensis SY62]GAC96890.1 hypothetical protein PHSY_004474 [Pseudozyma hubeiensis SY62]
MSASLQDANEALPDHHLDQEAAALAADILPIFASVASIDSIWSSERVGFTAQRRSIVYGGSLFFDELLTFAGVDTSLYPPRSQKQLSELLTAIFAAITLDYLKQLSLVYYLLLDLDAYSQRVSLDQDVGPSLTDSTSAAERFADTYVVLPQFTDAMQGYWLLDNDSYEQAIPLLAVADFVPKIVRTLFLPSQTEHRPDVTRAKLLLRFIRTSNQTTSSPPGSEAFLQEVEMQIQALCFVSGPSRALSEIRAITSTIQDDEQQRVSVRARLIFKVLEHCFAPPRPAAIQNLLACSLDPEEEVTLESFVLSPPAAMTATWSYVAADVLIARYISQGRYMDAVGLDRRLGPDVSQGHSTAKDAQQRSKMMEQRKRMIAGAREILPEVQKELLRIEESAEISGGAEVQQRQDKTDTGATNGVNGKATAIHDIADRSGLAPTPLSASPAARRSNTHTPSTQAAILSAVVRASASPSAPSTPTKASILGGALSANATPNATPGRSGLTPQHPAAMIGFLAKNALSGQDPAAAADSSTTDEAMDEGSQDVDGSAVLISKPVEGVKASSETPASPSQPAQAPSPWRNQPTLTSSSPFSGLPKLSRPAIAGGNASVASGSRSPYQSSPRAFQPANTSPFAAASASSVRGSPSLSSTTGRTKLPGALGIVSQHGKKSRLARDEPSVVSDESDVEDAEAQTEDGGDDTFVQTQKQGKMGKASAGDVSIGRLVPGRRGWKETQEDNAADDDEMQELLTSPEPPTKRRARKAAAAATPSKSKMSRSRTGVNLSSQDDTTTSKLKKSRSEVSLVPPTSAKRMTRSTSSANRKPLTLSNLEQHSRTDVAGNDAAPIARRTRAATAEMESVTGSQVEGGASTIYTISEVGDGVVEGRSPSKRGGRRTVNKEERGGVRRSSRLGGEVEESSPAKRRGGRRGAKMPGSLE